MKGKVIVLVFAVIIALFAGCAPEPAAPETPPQTTPPEATPQEATPDVVTTASIVADADAFKKAISGNGTWIICTTKDLSINEDLILEGEFHDKNDPAKDLKRKIALYAQDADKNVTARYTLTAPKLTVKSPNARIQGGTFKGDVYVSAKNFELVDGTIDGNVYFTTDDAKSTFKIDDKSKVTGKQELKK
ncbi:MAG TPA: hypothetical protein PKU88_09370 [Bacillota bacterium]|nr:hypothetical protein [Bacillota bacterium]HNT02921.1 hypothetical protein [Bacillota bacterium]HPX69523.1 hypothetical protein [Bacillota bacterium]HQA65304.1 hypothetical protein [Bacillota bacterium]HQO42105.1 hypothetical protein [Bacillota bacterium]